MSRSPKRQQHLNENRRNKHCSNHIQGCPFVAKGAILFLFPNHLLYINQIIFIYLLIDE